MSARMLVEPAVKPQSVSFVDDNQLSFGDEPLYFPSRHHLRVVPRHVFCGPQALNLGMIRYMQNNWPEGHIRTQRHCQSLCADSQLCTCNVGTEQGTNPLLSPVRSTARVQLS